MDVSYSWKTPNDFVNAFLYAYNAHIPLDLYPHHIQLHINMNVATFINANAERLRSSLVSHSELMTLKAILTGSDWENCLTQFEEQIRSYTKTSLTLHMNSVFSTSNRISTTANRIVIMAAMKNYFQYHFVQMCGVPQVNLMGTSEDWILLQSNYKVIKSLLPDLEWWWCRLDPIMTILNQMAHIEVGQSVPQEIIDAWSTMTSSIRYGSGVQQRLTGWLQYLLPFDEDGTPRWQHSDDNDGGISLEALPSSLCETPATVIMTESGLCSSISTSVPLMLQAGFIGLVLHKNEPTESTTITTPIVPTTTTTTTIAPTTTTTITTCTVPTTTTDITTTCTAPTITTATATTTKTMETFTPTITESKVASSTTMTIINPTTPTMIMNTMSISPAIGFQILKCASKDEPTPMTMEEYIQRVDKVDFPSTLFRQHLFSWIKVVQPQCIDFYCVDHGKLAYLVSWIKTKPDFSPYRSMIPVPYDTSAVALDMISQEGSSFEVYTHGVFTILIRLKS